MFVYRFKPVIKICTKCGALDGESFCGRSLLGEPGACEFQVLEPCKKEDCESSVPCYGHPCELADRLSSIPIRVEYCKKYK